MPYTYEYPRPSVCVDIIVLYKQGKKIFILLIERKHPPYENTWALPGGFIEMDETLEKSALRELHEETGLILKDVEQFATYGDPGRDPRGRTISVVYSAIIKKLLPLKAGDDASKAKWVELNKLPELAFDHKKIILDFYTKHKTDYLF